MESAGMSNIFEDVAGASAKDPQGEKEPSTGEEEKRQEQDRPAPETLQSSQAPQERQPTVDGEDETAKDDVIVAEKEVSVDASSLIPAAPAQPSASPKTSPVTSFLMVGAPVEVYVHEAEAKATTEPSEHGEGNYVTQEVGTIFEDRGVRTNCCKPPIPGTKIEVFHSADAEYQERKCSYKAEDYVYLIPRSPESVLHVAKLKCFQRRTSPDGKVADVALVQRHLRADNVMLSSIWEAEPTKKIPSEILSTSWESWRSVHDILDHASVCADLPEDGVASDESHVCRFHYDHILHKIKRISALGEGKKSSGNFADASTLQALELISTMGAGEASGDLIQGIDVNTSQTAAKASSNPDEEIPAEQERANLQLLSPLDEDVHMAGVNEKGSKRTREPLTPSAASFPLMLSSALKVRWSQERYQNGQRYLFLSLMNAQAHSREKAIRRSILRDEVRKMGIGDLGLIDHIIKALTCQKVLFSGHYIKKQHNEHGILEYWLATLDQGMDDADGQKKAKVMGTSQKQTFHINQKSLELPSSILTIVKEMRTMLSVLQDKVSDMALKQRPQDSSSIKHTGRDELTYMIVLQNVQEEMEKVVENYKRNFAHMLQPDRTELDELRQEFNNKMKAQEDRERKICTTVNKLRELVIQHDTVLLEHNKTSQPGNEGGSKGSSDVHLSQQIDSLKTEMAIMKTQHELFLLEGGARLDQLFRANQELKQQVAALRKEKETDALQENSLNFFTYGVEK